MLQESHECYWRYLYYVLTDILGLWEMILMSEWEKEWMKNCKLLTRNGLQRTKRKCYEVSLAMCYEMFLRWSFPKCPGLKCYEMTVKCYEVSPRGGSTSVFQVEILCSILKWSALKWPRRKCSEMSWDEMLQNLLCSVVKCPLDEEPFCCSGMKYYIASSNEVFWSVLRWNVLTCPCLPLIWPDQLIQEAYAKPPWHHLVKLYNRELFWPRRPFEIHQDLITC